jgi:hypothetical protein
MSDRELFSKQIDRLVASRTLHGSESLCRLLRYLAQHAIDEPGTPLKEYQIATEVFGRKADFDPQSDSTIRVQAGRLRAKVVEYYAAEGEHDPVVVELPKGSYLLNFRHRPNHAKPMEAPPPPFVAVPASLPQITSNRRPVFVLSALLALALLAILALLGLRRSNSPEAAAASTEHPPAEFQQFWNHFLSSPEEPWVVFSNAEFVGRPETGMRYYDKQRDAQARLWDHYTGVGEVLSVHELDQVFNSLHRQVRVKRGSLFSLDDAKNNDLIFVGSPSENLTLMEIPSTRDFVFQRMTSGPRSGDLAIASVHPQKGEEKFYLASRGGETLTEDYAVVGFLPGLNPARSVLILAGTTTFGTQAAVEYVCRKQSVRDLLTRLGTTEGAEVKPFEALLHVKVARGVPVETELVAVRKEAE